MESIEDNHEEEFYRFMQDQNKRKQERERLRMLTYEEQTKGAADSSAADNQLALVPLHDYDGEYTYYAENAGEYVTDAPNEA